MILWLKYQLIWITFKDLRYSSKDKENAVQNEVQIPCGRSKKQTKWVPNKIKQIFQKSQLAPFRFWFLLFKIVEIKKIH